MKPNIMSGMLVLTVLTQAACSKINEGMTDPTDGDSTAASDETGDTSTGATGGGATDTSISGEATGETGGSGESCACFSSESPGDFDILCPAEVKAEIDGACSNKVCTYDAAAVDAALTFLATGEAGIVTWKVDTGLVPIVSPRPLGPRAHATSAHCPYQFCSGGIHVATGDGKIFTQTSMNEDSSTTISPLTGATQRAADYFKECAQNADIVARFNCVWDAGQAPDLGDCAEGDELP